MVISIKNCQIEITIEYCSTSLSKAIGKIIHVKISQNLKVYKSVENWPLFVNKFGDPPQ